MAPRLRMVDLSPTSDPMAGRRRRYRTDSLPADRDPTVLGIEPRDTTVGYWMGAPGHSDTPYTGIKRHVYHES